MSQDVKVLEESLSGVIDSSFGLTCVLASDQVTMMVCLST